MPRIEFGFHLVLKNRMNSIPTFSLAYTSVRPAWIPQVIKMWNERSHSKDHEWVIAQDSGTSEATVDAVRAACADPRAKCLHSIQFVTNTGRKNCVDGWNVAAAGTKGKIIVGVSDDFVPPEGWDRLILQAGPSGWEEKDHVVHVNDGFVGHICTLAIITRQRYEKFGYLWYPGYESMFCDTELTDVANRDGVMIEAMHLLFEHMHHACGKRPKDENDAKHENTERWKRGEMLYNFRKARRFPLDLGPKAEAVNSAARAAREYVAYLQINRDDICLFETCERLFQEGVKTFYFSVPSEYWDGRKTSSSDLEGINSARLKLLDLGAKVNTKIFKVPMYRLSGDSRVDTETRLRNDSLAWIRADGHKDILIVDGDELWLPGTLHIVDNFVSQGHIAISTQMIPVVGLPGYPVDQATDVAVVYIGGACQFKACRTPMAQQLVINRPQIIHFTGTRRTMQEIIDKHRTSGHYDDPDYDFEGWLANTLPNIKPGLKNVHMYKKFQIWPRIRDWRPEEIALIPQSLHPYLPFPK